MGCLVTILLFLLGIRVADDNDGGCGCMLVILLAIILYVSFASSN